MIYDKERVVEASRIRKVGCSMTSIKLSKRSLSNFDDKRFYKNKIKSYPHDKNMYLFKRDSLAKFKKRLYRDKEKDHLINNFKELTINSNRELIEAAI